MWYLRLAILFIFFPLVLSAQHTAYDTLSPFDTIPPGTRMLKGAGDFTFETVVDSANTLVINEFLASNSGLFLDNYGDDDDWIEIFNFGDDPVRLNKLYFTDDPAEPLNGSSIHLWSWSWSRKSIL